MMLRLMHAQLKTYCYINADDIVALVPEKEGTNILLRNGVPVPVIEKMGEIVTMMEKTESGKKE